MEVLLLGSTGSIGCSTLRVIDQYPDLFIVKGLVCHSNLELLSTQIKKYHPQFCAISCLPTTSSSAFADLKNTFPGTKFFTGKSAVTDLVKEGADICVSAIVGAAGLQPTLEALKSCKRVALANKESLVMAGNLVFAEAKRYKCEIIPVDSEHSAIFSLLSGVDRKALDSIILTASGGSLRDYPLEQLQDVTPDVALAHPTWNMGNKITIDSATLINKGLEVIEAHHLFNVSYDKIRVIVHPESLVHSMVEAIDGAVYAHLGVADMAYPISYAMLYPQSVANDFAKLDLVKAGSLTFKDVEEKRFPALKLCYQAGKTGGTAPTVLNAANEVAVHAFLERKVAFTQIVSLVENALNNCSTSSHDDISSILESDHLTRVFVTNLINSN